MGSAPASLPGNKEDAASAVVLGTLAESRIISSGEVEDGNTLGSEIRTALVEYGIIYADEQVEQYYFLGFFSKLAEGALLTDRAVIYYYRLYENAFEVVYFPFEQIIHIDKVEVGSTLSDSIYLFESINFGTIFIPLSDDNEVGARFMETVGDRMNAQYRGQPNMANPEL